MQRHPECRAFCLLPTDCLNDDVEFFTETVGFKLTSLYPAESPQVAELSGFGMNLRLDTGFQGACATLLISSEQPPKASAVSPSGVEIRWESLRQNRVQSIDSFRPEVCTLRGANWIAGKAGTHTRELIPSKLGGALSATHIRVPNGGPVTDRVHHHSTSFQLVFCVRGWITLVYEDQGEPLTLQAGDCVTQPPHIRHKVVEMSNGLEVIEFGMPAEHVTTIDDDLILPNGRVDSHRLFDGQRFCHHKLESARWHSHRLPGFDGCDTGVATASSGLAGAKLVRASTAPPAYTATHDAQLVFTYVLAGSVRFDGQLMVAGDAFTLPAIESVRVADISADARMLELSVPGVFRTVIQ